MTEQFLLDIRQHDGVFYQDLAGQFDRYECPDFLLNLRTVVRIRYDNADDSFLRLEAIRGSIQFIEISGQELFLLFSDAGMGEYNRYKRQISEFVIGSCGQKPELEVV
ncbi:hypothetical protein [Endozoicomonas euniceicola]|uniref:Uncharacterized protein n=1 Tax=Endozoicomonas euniceicola TaxID=1234143 RepID=A0ABY6GU60_9GAMM|nr:hypothetical protein [Endozoicomonas euniceicola]UYM16313.1 hypothetical protein NX720_26555 [Endozoicomonas euniceicola]